MNSVLACVIQDIVSYPMNTSYMRTADHEESGANSSAKQFRQCNNYYYHQFENAIQ
jgi:hypothetical protein